jgi:hypothetical protein
MTDPDIMLLKLESEVVGVPPLRLNSDPSVPVDMESVTIMGLGQTSFEGSFPDQLLEADINIVSIDDCNDDSSFKNFIQGDRQICANDQGKDICSGDSGSPLIYMDSTGTPIQVGLSSFGRGCGNFEFPGIHTRVSYFYHDWILPNLCNMAVNPPNECNALTTNNSNSTSDVTALNATNAAVTPSPTTKSPIHPPTVDTFAYFFFTNDEAPNECTNHKHRSGHSNIKAYFLVNQEITNTYSEYVFEPSALK